ncbi:carboxypeptidase-like regulatory domain-containing protein [Deinococcus apachensis]|uniref:carboxypeptidase-like regulatory domain-containing protein n=1 Tax=Deinococcus apachensis TaxID=309886 RepID=UPI00036B6866|nr:carboxypeptidase-like regulatory domain-containing protein [Deinococcus apachensis]
MNRNALTALLGLTLSLVAQALPAASAPRTIKGTITAAGGHSLKDTVVIACPKGDCDSDDVKGAVIASGKARADFTITDLENVPYALYAVQDNDGDEDVSVGDWVDRNLLEEKEAALVKVGTANVKLELVEVKRAAAAPGTNTQPRSNTTKPAAPSATTAQRGFITGTVVNEQGVPLPGVEVVADNTLAYNSNLITRTDAQGRYKIDVRNAPVTFNVTASLTIKYDGYSARVDLVPQNPETVPGGVGGVRNFTFKPKPVTQQDPYGNLACVFVEREAGNFDIDPAQVILTLTPVGKLADGSTGKVRQTKLVMSGGGWVAANVMWGTYKVTGTMNGHPIELRRRIGGMDTYEWGMSYTGGFTRDYQSLQPNMFLEIRLPKN